MFSNLPARTQSAPPVQQIQNGMKPMNPSESFNPSSIDPQKQSSPLEAAKPNDKSLSASHSNPYTPNLPPASGPPNMYGYVIYFLKK